MLFLLWGICTVNTSPLSLCGTLRLYLRLYNTVSLGESNLPSH
jgi:hypothetical protein